MAAAVVYNSTQYGVTMGPCQSQSESPQTRSSLCRGDDCARRCEDDFRSRRRV